MDVVLLSRIQFDLTNAFHIVVPVLTIGLALYLVIVEWLWLSTHNALFYRKCRFRVRNFFIHFIGLISFARWGAAFFLSVVPGRLFYSYRVFHGKIIYGEGYE